ncbi:SRPBCC domain-containing protein [Rubellimicrobium arenae]|uniref:SRPBCC domain-containing protein n=1 Tax=Rubellimicrobium arenae TaxID=2817372 RepID=UPI001B310618|nr:SRPBCC domain-containing protein [Rubellimicrobium arenae]
MTAEDLSVTLTRHFRAGPVQVYEAWTNPDALPRWFGPEGYSCRTHSIDVREGGEWLFDMIGHGMTFANRHRWTELRPHSRIAFLMDAGEGSGDPLEVVVTLDPEGDGTRLRQTMRFPSPERLAEARSYQFEDRGQETLAKLAASLGE